MKPEEIQKNFEEYITETGGDPRLLRFRNVNIKNLKNEVETLDKPDIVDLSTAPQNLKDKLTDYSKHIMEQAAFTINQKHDKVMVVNSTLDGVFYWLKKLGKSIKSLSGKGAGILHPDF
jgi:predicted metal-dependent hydrolase